MGGMVTQAPQIETLRSNLAELIAESQALRSDVKSAERARRRENFVSLALSLIGVLVIGMVLFLAFQTQQIGDQIASCTTPDGQCYQDASKRTSGTVQKIVAYQVIVAECARATKTDADLEKCVTDRIAQAETKGR